MSSFFWRIVNRFLLLIRHTHVYVAWEYQHKDFFKSFHKLNCFISDYGPLGVRCHLKYLPAVTNERLPWLLLSNSRSTNLIIEYYHRKYFQATLWKRINGSVIPKLPYARIFCCICSLKVFEKQALSWWGLIFSL